MFTCPSTGALVAVEVDVLLDSSTAPDSVHLQLLARGPIGKYGFHLESARVQGERHPPGHAFMLRQADMLSLQEQQQLDGPAEGCRTVTGCRAVHTGALLETIMHASKRVSMHKSTPMLLSHVVCWCGAACLQAVCAWCLCQSTANCWCSTHSPPRWRWNSAQPTRQCCLTTVPSCCKWTRLRRCCRTHCKVGQLGQQKVDHMPSGSLGLWPKLP